MDIYDNNNAFELKSSDIPDWARNKSAWRPLERYIARLTDGTPLVTFRQISQHDAVMDGMAGGDCIGADDAILGPVGANGYPQKLWNRETGAIDRAVANYWRIHSDLYYYTEKNWPAIGRMLVDKLHRCA